jgi:hypothetical protein
LWALLGVLLYLISPTITALDVSDAEGNQMAYPGWPLLLFGWVETLGVLSGKVSGAGWLANPLFVLGTLRVLLDYKKGATAVMLAAAVISLASFLLNEVYLDEAGNTAKVVGYRLGFWLWMAAIWWNLIVAVMTRGRPKDIRDSKTPR